MILYDYQGAPSPRRVRIFLAEKGIVVPTQQVDLAAGAQFDEAFSRINPAHQVPALVLDDGTLIAESVAICRYFEALQPDPPLFGATPAEQGAVEMWHREVEFNGLLHCRDAFRNKVAGMAGRALPGTQDEVAQIPDLVDRAAAGLARFFRRLDERLGDSTWLAGDRYSIADIGALVMVDFATRLKLGPGPDQKGVARWYAAASSRPSAAA